MGASLRGAPGKWSSNEAPKYRDSRGQVSGIVRDKNSGKEAPQIRDSGRHDVAPKAKAGPASGIGGRARTGRSTFELSRALP